MPKRTIFNKNSKKLQNKNFKNIERDIFNCLLNNRSRKPLSQKEIAEKIGCSASTVSRHIKTLLNDKQPSGEQYYSIKWTFRGYIMEREDVCNNEYNDINQNNYREELIYDLAKANVCTMSEINIITSTVIFCGITSKFVDAFDSAFRSIFHKNCYHNIVHIGGGVYIILKETSKKDLQNYQHEISNFYKDIVTEMENIRCQKFLCPSKTVKKLKK